MFCPLYHSKVEISGCFTTTLLIDDNLDGMDIDLSRTMVLIKDAEVIYLLSPLSHHLGMSKSKHICISSR